VALLLGDESTVRISIDIATEGSTPLLVRRNLWLQGMDDCLLSQAQLFKELREKVNVADQRKATLDRAQAGLKDLQRDLENFAKEEQALQDTAKAQTPPARLDVSHGKIRMDALKQTEEKLKTFVANLDKAVKDESDPKRQELQALSQQGQLLEDEGEYGKAIEVYEKVLASGLELPMLKEKVDKLKAGWKVQGPEHEQARKFIYDVWPDLDLIKTKDGVEEATKAFQTCKAVHDKLAPKKLLRAAFAHAAKLSKESGALQPDVNEEDGKTAQTIAKVAEELKKLITDVSAYTK
jgi:hypothetical protein